MICRQWGGLEQLQIGEAPLPRPGSGEVLIRVKATAVNYADAIMVAGRYQTKPELPFSPGLETAGVIEACGPDVQGLKPGDRVMAILAYAVIAEASGVAPASISMAAATISPLRRAMTHNPSYLHLDEEYCRNETEFGQRLVNSCFTLSLMVGISVGDARAGRGPAKASSSFPPPRLQPERRAGGPLQALVLDEEDTGVTPSGGEAQ